SDRRTLWKQYLSIDLSGTVEYSESMLPLHKYLKIVRAKVVTDNCRLSRMKLSERLLSISIQDPRSARPPSRTTLLVSTQDPVNLDNGVVGKILMDSIDARWWHQL